jgi:hypothetical protein
MHLNALLQLEDIDPASVLVMRHCPSEPALRKILPWLAAERHEIFNAYQQTQSNEKSERALARATYVASFIGDQPGRALFVGLYARGGSTPLSYEEYWSRPEYIEMKKFGMRGFKGGRNNILWFDLTRTGFYNHWAGKLIVDWPGGERTWRRWAQDNILTVQAVLEESAFTPPLNDWRELTLSWADLKVLPSSWRGALAEWRGIYLILDEIDGRGYVGSACGRENMLGRWLNYAASGHGQNAALRNRNPESFRFSILERLSPDKAADEVMAIENSWKLRLQTRLFGLNRN